MTSFISSFLNVWSQIESLIDGQENSVEIESLIQNTKILVESIRNINSLVEVTPEWKAKIPNLGITIFDYLLIRYLETFQRRIYYIGCFLGIISEGNLVENNYPEIDFEYLTKFIENPLTLSDEIYGWGNQ